MAGISARTYSRKTYDVEAVQILDWNIDAIAVWCSGEVKATPSGRRYIDTKTKQYRRDLSRYAFVGDWIVLVGGGYRVYQNKDFKAIFETATETKFKRIHNLVWCAMLDLTTAIQRGSAINTNLESRKVARQIVNVLEGERR